MSYYVPINLPPGFPVPPDISADDIRAAVEDVEKYIVFSFSSDKEEKATTLACLAGVCPPLLISEYSELERWPQYMGLTLLIGFCPKVLIGMDLPDLMQLKGEKLLCEVLLTVPQDSDFFLYLRRLDNFWLDKKVFGLELDDELIFGIYHDVLCEFAVADPAIEPPPPLERLLDIDPLDIDSPLPEPEDKDWPDSIPSETVTVQTPSWRDASTHAIFRVPMRNVHSEMISVIYHLFPALLAGSCHSLST